MNARTIGLLLVVAVGIAVFSYKLGQHETQSPVASGINRGVGEDLARDDQEDQAARAATVQLRQGNMTGEGGKAGVVAHGKVAQFEIGSRNVKGIYVDGKYIWFATSGGVIRYDNTTDNYDVFNNKTPGILSNGIFHISKLDDRIVVGTYGGGLSILNPATKEWRNYNIPQGLADQFVYDVHKAKNGDVWVATWSGVNRIRQGAFDDPKSWETFTVESTQGGLPNPWVYKLDEGRDGEMWFATEAGLARFKDGTWQNWQHKQGLGAPLEKVKAAIQFTNDPAKASKHHAQQKAEQGLQGVDVAYNPNYIISLVVDNDGIVWCGTWGGGLARFDGNTWENFTTQEGLPGNHIFMLYKDDKGELWIGTSQGLTRMDRASRKFSTLTTADGLYAENVFSMANASDGTVWVGSFGGVAHITPKVN